MASFDIKSLFANIPVQFTINLILNQIYVQDVKTFHRLTITQPKSYRLGHALVPCFNSITKYTNK